MLTTVVTELQAKADGHRRTPVIVGRGSRTATPDNQPMGVEKQ